MNTGSIIRKTPEPQPSGWSGKIKTVGFFFFHRHTVQVSPPFSNFKFNNDILLWWAMINLLVCSTEGSNNTIPYHTIQLAHSSYSGA